MKLANTPVTQHSFLGQAFFLKRDDLLHPQFSGNKARKLMSLLQLDPERYNTLIGHGSAQSNAMYSLAALAKIKGWKAEFVVDHIPNWLRNNPIGNYRESLLLGMKIHSLADLGINTSAEHYIKQIRGLTEGELFVPEGGRSPVAQEGVELLAEEILSWQSNNKVNELTVALPSGTGTTALYLAQRLQPLGVEVITCACVGGTDYLTEQFNMLSADHHPTILPSSRKHHFAKLYRSDFETWLQLNADTGIEFDLLYDPFMWECLIPWRENNPDKPLMYIHQGGLLGNESMLARYRRKFPELAKL